MSNNLHGITIISGELRIPQLPAINFYNFLTSFYYDFSSPVLLPLLTRNAFLRQKGKLNASESGQRPARLSDAARYHVARNKQRPDPDNWAFRVRQCKVCVGEIWCAV
jgi:hypothetical protein